MNLKSSSNKNQSTNQKEDNKKDLLNIVKSFVDYFEAIDKAQGTKVHGQEGEA